MATVLGVLLAAGRGTRFEDGNELLAEIDGEPVVVHAARTLVRNVNGAGTPLDDVVAILGHESDRVEGALTDLDLRTIRNPNYGDGQATAVALGALIAEEEGFDAALFALGDLPRVTPGTARQLVEAFEQADAEIVVPTHDDRRGNPVLFGRRHFEELAGLTGDRGGRALFEAYPVERVPVDDPGIHLDVDTVADLRRVRES